MLSPLRRRSLSRCAPQLEAYYQKHDPKKVPLVPQILAKCDRPASRRAHTHAHAQASPPPPRLPRLAIIRYIARARHEKADVRSFAFAVFGIRRRPHHPPRPPRYPAHKLVKMLKTKYQSRGLRANTLTLRSTEPPSFVTRGVPIYTRKGPIPSLCGLTPPHPPRYGEAPKTQRKKFKSGK